MERPGVQDHGLGERNNRNSYLYWVPTLHVQIALFPLQTKEGSHSFIIGFQTFFFKLQIHFSRCREILYGTQCTLQTKLKLLEIRVRAPELSFFLWPSLLLFSSSEALRHLVEPQFEHLCISPYCCF